MPHPYVRSFSRTRFALVAAGVALTISTVAQPVAAQVCAGLPSGSGGIGTVGFEGTDGATGAGLGLGYHNDSAGVLVQRRSLDAFTLVDELGSWEVQGSARVPGVKAPLCLTGALNWTSYDNQRRESSSYNLSDPAYVVERHRVGGPYNRLRVPVGLSVGHELDFGPVSLIPFASPAVVFEAERYDPENGAAVDRSALGWAAAGGVTATAGRFLLRTTLHQTWTREYALSSQHNWAWLSMHVGFRFR